MLSEYYKKISCGDLYAVFNSLYFQPVYVKESELENIENEQVTAELREALFGKKIYVRGSEDAKRIKLMKEIDTKTSGQIDTLYLILSKNCNLRCKYCMVQNGGYKKQDMSMVIAIRTIDLFAKYIKNNHRESGRVIFYGGEPLMNKQLFIDIVKYIKTLNVNIIMSLVTNGTLLDPDVVNIIEQNNITVGISLDGPKALNDKNRIYRDGRGTFDDVVSGIEILKERGISYGISLCVSPQLIEKENEFYEWLKNHKKIPGFNINLFHYNNYNTLWREETEASVDFVMRFYDFCITNHISENKLTRRLYALQYGEPIFSECAACGENQLVVFPDGNVGVCHVDREVNSRLPNIMEAESLETLIEHDELSKWKKRTNCNKESCEKCEAFFICGGGCYRQKEILNCNENDETFCIYAKRLTSWIMEKMCDKDKI